MAKNDERTAVQREYALGGVLALYLYASHHKRGNQSLDPLKYRHHSHANSGDLFILKSVLIWTRLGCNCLNDFPSLKVGTAKASIANRSS